jgi:hypothetical protein
MDRAERARGKVWAVDEFLKADQNEFGSAWRYELVDGHIIAHAAPSPDHGAIISSLVTACIPGYEAARTAAEQRRAAEQLPKISSAKRSGFPM